MENAMLPVTALAFCQLDRLYLLAGEGPYMKIFDHETKHLLARHRIFKSRTVHGIFVHQIRLDSAGICGPTVALVWGGGSARVVRLGRNDLQFEDLIPEIDIDGWFLDGVLLQYDGSEGRLSCQAFLVTTSNDVLYFGFDPDLGHITASPRTISGPCSQALFYSAHIFIVSHQELRVAVGSAFGRVIVYSIRRKADDGSYFTHRVCLDVDAHQGSVFGVRLAGRFLFKSGVIPLASCSDDRTIRIWDISKDCKGRCLASQMGHSSRIWNVKFIYGQWPQLLSSGEDGTLQIWDLKNVEGVKDASGKVQINHKTTNAFHTGKNIWSTATLDFPRGNCLLATGGADGRIVTYRNNSDPGIVKERTYSMGEVLNQMYVNMPPRTILRQMSGSWNISRKIKSNNISYPSGTLSGLATLESRSPTDASFEDEYLYTENGEYVTEQGFMMKASRQYAYRYSRESGEASAWFVKTDGSAAVDYLFHRIGFGQTKLKYQTPEQKASVSAQGHHLCIDDDYTAHYDFQFLGEMLQKWHVKYIVKGPSKDYTAHATYTRSTEQSNCVPKIDTPRTNGSLTRADAFKSYTWIHTDLFLTTTEQGLVLLGKTQPSSKLAGSSDESVGWEKIGQIDTLRSTALATSVPSMNLTFLMDGNGGAHVYCLGTKEITSFPAVGGKPAFVKAQKLPYSWITTVRSSSSADVAALITTYLGRTVAEVSFFQSNIRIHSLSLQLPERFITTSVCFLNEPRMLMLASREGDVCIYEPENVSRRVLQPTRRIRVHSDAVTTFSDFEDPQFPGACFILTTGRDSRYAIHRASLVKENGQQFKFETVHESTVPFGPNIEGACFDTTSQALFLWGFRSTSFVVWNETRKTEVMTVECGGAHRNWAYMHREGTGGGSFVWTRASHLKLYTQQNASHDVLQYGGHGREIKAMAIAPTEDSESRLVATGAEDTAVRIFNYCRNTGLQCSGILARHTTGVQKLAWSCGGDILFSAGGCEEFYAWSISHVPRIGTGTVCILECPKVSEEGDLRIMDFDIIEDQWNKGVGSLICMGYSDSSVRLYRLVRLDSGYRVDLLSQGSYGSSCITQIKYVRFGKSPYLFTAHIDGYLAAWPLNAQNADQGDLTVGSHAGETGKIAWTNRFAVHQNAVQSLACIGLNENEVLVITGGDDQAISIASICEDTDKAKDFTYMVATFPNAHASAITGIAHLGSLKRDDRNEEILFASVGNDQRLKTWNARVPNKDTALRLETVNVDDVYTSVGDASSLEVLDDGCQNKLCIAGIGMECWIVNEHGFLAADWQGV